MLLNNKSKDLLYTLFVALPLLLSSCVKSNFINTDIIFLGHKGSGSNNYSDTFIENTMPSVKNLVDKLDGAELDIQMSLDGTLWIWHNADLSGYDCNGQHEGIIPEMRDEAIEKISICHQNKTDRIYKLSEILDWNNTGPGIYLSFDIKTAFNPSTFSLYGDKNGYLKQLAVNMAEAFKNYRLSNRTLVEVDSKEFCTTLKSFSSTKDIITCFMRYEPMENKIKNAVKLGYDGISCNYTDPTVTALSIAEAKRLGLKVQLWTPYYREDLRKVFAMNPDFIQTDNIYAKQALKIR